MGRHPTPLEERLKARLVRRPNGCLEWTGHTIRKGYGQILNDAAAIAEGRPKQIGTHKAAWEIVHGPVPEGLEIRHKCDNPPCCDVEHLEIGTSQDNADDCQTRQRHYWHGREKCRKGHTFGPEDVNRATGRRQCKQCLRAASRDWKKRQKASV